MLLSGAFAAIGFLGNISDKVAEYPSCIKTGVPHAIEKDTHSS